MEVAIALGSAVGSAAAPLTSAATFMQVAAPIASGAFGLMQAQGEKERAQVNAYIGRTRAIQTDVSARSGMESELGAMRNVMAANQQRPNVGTAEIFNDLRNVRGRERRIEFGNRMSEAADWRMQGRAAAGRGAAAMFGGLIKAGPSLMDLYELRRGPR